MLARKQVAAKGKLGEERRQVVKRTSEERGVAAGLHPNARSEVVV